MKHLTILGVAALALALSGCQTVQRVDAAGDVHRFLIAIRDNDKPTFDLYVDKPALTHELEGRLGDLARQQAGDQNGRALGAVLAGPLARAAADAALRPQVFRLIAVALGYSSDKPIPGQMAIATALRPLADGQVCVAKKRDQPCLLTFTLEGEAWKLTAVDMGSLKL